MLKKLKKPSLAFIAFLQAWGLMVYVGLVALLFWKGEEIFGKVDLYLGPVMLLTLFVVSALISALIVLGYPFIIFWEEKKTRKALKLVGYTIFWLIFFFFAILASLIVY